MTEILYAVNTAANVLLALAVLAAVAFVIVSSRRTATTYTRDPQATPDAPEGVDTSKDPETAPQTLARTPADFLVTAAPLLDGVTLREWLIHHHPQGDGVWVAVVRDFYDRAASVPEIADYFRHANMNRLRQHFAGALARVAGQGLTASDMDALEAAHAPIVNSYGRPITQDVYTAVVGTLVAVLRDHGVPEEGIGALAGTIAPLNAAIVHP